MVGESMLRVANISDEADLEAVRDVLDEVGGDYEHLRSEPDEDIYPQTAYFYVSDDVADAAENALNRLADERGFEVELL
jgi:hypothetical protein